jgi:hypothetical protein
MECALLEFAVLDERGKTNTGRRGIKKKAEGRRH